MDPEEFAESLSVNSRKVKRSARSHPLPPNRAEGVSLGQAMREWHVDERKLYLLEQLGRLLGIRVGNRVFYSRARLIELLGEPTNPGPQRARFQRRRGRILNGDSTSGG